MKNKSLIIVAFIVIAIFCFGFLAKAQTIDAQTLIAQLEAQIAQLTAQLNALLTQQNGNQQWCHNFNVDLKYGDDASNPDVISLQKVLSKEGLYKIIPQEDGYFGEMTASSVVAFQEKYASEILTPVGLIHGTGIVGPKTRAKLNALYGCGIIPLPTVQCTKDSDCPITTAICAPGMICPGPKCINGQCIQQQSYMANNTDSVAKKVVDYINSNGLSASPASLISATEVDGLVEVSLKIGTSNFDSYATKDGQLLFSQGFDMGNADSTLSSDAVAKKAVDYINNKGLSSTPAALVSFNETNGLIEIKIGIGSNNMDSYATKDGRFLFPQAFDMNKVNATASNQNPTQPSGNAATSITKTSSPILEAYIVSRCPYGLQMQRAMADAVQNIPGLAQYLKVRYIGSVSEDKITSMHGGAEAVENLRQICIREEQPTKYWDYVACQMKSSGTEADCDRSTGVDPAKLNACISDPSRGVAYAKIDFDLDTKYNISGSPTLILNGAQISETPFGGRSSDAIKSIVCAGFDTKPNFCSQKLNTAEAATSFSPTYSTNSGASASAGGCGIPNNQ